jgi:RNA polymerase sigma factor (sigma-70 family)
MSDRELDFAAFYDEFLPQVYRYVRYRVADTAIAEDLTATIFEKALRAWNERRKPNSVAPWIFRIARNTVVSHYRWRSLRLQVPLDSAEGEPSVDATPEESVLHSERWTHIQDGIQTLSHREQHIIALKFGSELTNRAIAPIVGVSEGNVAVILHRAMRKLHVHLESEQAPVATPTRRISYG